MFQENDIDKFVPIFNFHLSYLETVLIVAGMSPPPTTTMSVNKVTSPCSLKYSLTGIQVNGIKKKSETVFSYQCLFTPVWFYVHNLVICEEPVILIIHYYNESCRKFLSITVFFFAVFALPAAPLTAPLPCSPALLGWWGPARCSSELITDTGRTQRSIRYLFYQPQGWSGGTEAAQWYSIKKEMLIINSRVWQYHNPLLNIGNQKPQCRNKENITVLGCSHSNFLSPLCLGMLFRCQTLWTF